MTYELETLVRNLIVALSKKDISKYPKLDVYRHHMRLTVDPDDQLHGLFDNIDLDNKALLDLLTCSSADVVRLHEHLLGLRLNEFDPSTPAAVYWLRVDERCRGETMSGLYDSVKTFLDSIPEGERLGQRISLGDCSGLVTWKVVQRHIVNNPRDIVLANLNHPNRFFTPSVGLYTKMRDAKDDEVLPSLDYVSVDDVRNTEPTWFTVGKIVRNSIVL